MFVRGACWSAHSRTTSRPDIAGDMRTRSSILLLAACSMHVRHATSYFDGVPAQDTNGHTMRHRLRRGSGSGTSCDASAPYHTPKCTGTCGITATDADCRGLGASDSSVRGGNYAFVSATRDDIRAPKGCYWTLEGTAGYYWNSGNGLACTTTRQCACGPLTKSAKCVLAMSLSTLCSQPRTGLCPAVWTLGSLSAQLLFFL